VRQDARVGALHPSAGVQNAGVGRAYGGNLILMDVIGAQVVLERDRRIDQVDVTLDPGTTADVATGRIEAMLPEGLEVLAARAAWRADRAPLRSYRTPSPASPALALARRSSSAAPSRRRSPRAARELGPPLRAGYAPRRRRSSRAKRSSRASPAPCSASRPLVLARALLDTATESTALIFSMQTFSRGLDVTP
jgi:hypothetical protein